MLTHHCATSTLSSLVLATHSSQPLIISQLRVTPRVVSRAIIGRVRCEGKLTTGRSGNALIYKLHDSGMIAFVLANPEGASPVRFKLDMTGTTGLVPARGSLVTEDVVPAGKIMLLNTLAAITGGWSSASRMSWQQVGRGAMERHEPGIFSPGLHETLDDVDAGRG